MQGFRSTSLREARHTLAVRIVLISYLDPLASGRLDDGRRLKGNVKNNLDPLASGRLDRCMVIVLSNDSGFRSTSLREARLKFCRHGSHTFHI